MMKVIERIKFTGQREIASQVLTFVDWYMERSEQQQIVDHMLDHLEGRLGYRPTARAINTMQVCQLRAEAIQLTRKPVVGANEEAKKGIAGAFKRIKMDDAAQYGY